MDDIKLYSVDLGGGIEDKKTLEFKFLPNPMSKNTIIELNDYREFELTIFDVQGRILKQTSYINNQPIIINRDKINSGIYFVKLRTDDNLIRIKKLIII